MIKNKDQYLGRMAQTLLSKYNPFGFTMDDGSSMVFESVTSAYMVFLTTTWIGFPRGYIEMPLLIMKHYRHITYKEAMKICIAFKPLGVDMVVTIDSYESKSGKDALERICRALCSISNVAFNEYAFKEAYQLLIHRIEIENGKSKSNTSHT